MDRQKDVDKKYIGVDYQDLPRGDRLKLQHTIAGIAFDTLVANGPMVSTELVGRLSQGETGYNEAAVYYGLQDGISRGLLSWDSDGTVRIVATGTNHD